MTIIGLDAGAREGTRSSILVDLDTNDSLKGVGKSLRRLYGRGSNLRNCFSYETILYSKGRL